MEGLYKAELTFFEGLGVLWNFQLFVVEGSPITLGKVLIGLFLVVMGYFFSGLVSRVVGRRVIGRLELQSSLKYNLERVVFYVVYIFCVLFVLQLLSIPITVFTVIGGALAIGIGFGSQNVVNNFISGLIVMIEQPVRVGDQVEIDGLFGRVEEIGSRSTYIRTGDSKQAVIPNSFFLEKAFINWTLSDRLVSGKVNVGVAYGSDVEKVRELLLQAARDHKDVLKIPAPVVTFQDFGESSLSFSLTFSISFSEDCTVGRVGSDLRFTLHRLLAQNGIVMPFPHRELVFDSKKPIVVELNRS